MKVEYCGLYSVCSIRHDFYGGCRDSAEGGRFCHATVYTLPPPGNSFKFIVFCKPFFPKFQKKSGRFPFLEITVKAAGTAVFSRQSFPLNPGSQNVDNRLKNLPRLHRFAPTSFSWVDILCLFLFAPSESMVPLLPKMNHLLPMPL